MATTELQMFLGVWDAEAQKTAALLRALPAGQYDFRPDAGARSLGELAWHLAEAGWRCWAGWPAGRPGGCSVRTAKRWRACGAGREGSLPSVHTQLATSAVQRSRRASRARDSDAVSPWHRGAKADRLHLVARRI